MLTTGEICVSVAANEVARALELAAKAAPKASVLEIRLDALAKPEIAPFVEKLAVPLLFTCRPEWEGGSFTGTEEERFALPRRRIVILLAR